MLQYSPWGNLLGAACAKGVCLWRFTHGEPFHTTHGAWMYMLESGEAMKGLQFSPCGRFVAGWSGTSRQVHIWSVLCGQEHDRVSLLHTVRNVSWESPDKFLVVTYSGFYVVNVSTWEATHFNSGPSLFTGVCSKDGSTLLLASRNYLSVVSCRSVYESGSLIEDAWKPIADLSAEPIGTGRTKQKLEVKKMVWSPCGQRLAISFRRHPTQRRSSLVCVLGYDNNSQAVIPIGYIQSPRDKPGQKPYPLEMSFRPNFLHGALLAVCWSHGVITQHHLCYKLPEQF